MSSKRVIVAIVMLIIALGSVAAGGVFIALFMGALIFVGTGELVNIARAKGMNPPFYFIAVSSLVLLGLASFRLYELLFPVFTGISILMFLLMLFRGAQAAVNEVSMSMFSVIYGGVFPIHIVMTRNLGMGYVLLLFLVIAACDIGAYYTGKFFGKTPLWPEVSPKKTIEGSVGGTLLGVFVSALAGHFIGISIFDSVAVGLLITIFAQLGDLSESMLKRDVGIKDSGTVLPGHGGVLDRSDSYIFTGVAAFYYFRFFVVG